MSDACVFRLPLRVYWEDTDGAGIVYYANYLRFLERARTEWLRARGFGQAELARDHGVVFVVRSITLDFLRPARLDDALEVSVSAPRVGASTLEIEQSVERNGERLVGAGVKLACVRIAAFQPARIPRDLRVAFAG